MRPAEPAAPPPNQAAVSPLDQAGVPQGQVAPADVPAPPETAAGPIEPAEPEVAERLGRQRRTPAKARLVHFRQESLKTKGPRLQARKGQAAQPGGRRCRPALQPRSLQRPKTKVRSSQQMAEFTAKDVQSLRNSTGAGMLDAKRALTAADGDAAGSSEMASRTRAWQSRRTRRA